MKDRMLRVALVSMKHIGDDPSTSPGPRRAESRCDVAANLERHEMWLQRGLDAGANFIGFPEWSLTGWIFDRDRSLTLTSPVLAHLDRWAMKHKVYIGTCFIEKRGSKLHNDCMLTGPKGRIGIMRKLNLTSGEVKYTSGKLLPVFKVAGCTMGVAICADGGHDLIRTLSFRGAEVIFAPAGNKLHAYGNHAAGWLKWRTESFPKSARDGRVYIAGVSAAGLTENAQKDEEATVFCGGGAVFDFNGDVVALASVGETKKECMIVTDLDLDALRKARSEKFSGGGYPAAMVYNFKRGWKDS